MIGALCTTLPIIGTLSIVAVSPCHFAYSYGAKQQLKFLYGVYAVTKKRAELASEGIQLQPKIISLVELQWIPLKDVPKIDELQLDYKMGVTSQSWSSYNIRQSRQRKRLAKLPVTNVIFANSRQNLVRSSGRNRRFVRLRNINWWTNRSPLRWIYG
ncbi:hypothetical protein F5J12DRAFT_928258 [Pisolithus orientalis]|uniref:uncharacterized protein n=1 Tax=Pisolithus orientalis TaxID=936130 RepID=UPI0022257002|nr:uncharacterized protein F5J12DRAFT_928258 [Pisolithus orientalis]KAI6002282.1 hypothetical protein F5J12DRAFT_928258 [Pisolithus orientalis]